ncbi:HDOD domain-containing protein [Dasania sp. GY-MA-18]|uniref:HDOD domain-containing protein n=1 Tax=Dasania phycosphaerae TaxID=2950436 RepID=A0A9J6RK97_9GAMM|nr:MULTISPECIES: HDOD domain-containing protein [Dasania]MCR8922187.1 HDOD domain-containing protein [Dasania sp. GY-MA-18]MCZ0864615.1 HDOD domain-containing protein [Dasania phycosphaerae]MCZ0868343.1 HDOD domain-containing protein [Dasania phycosphaerae]
MSISLTQEQVSQVLQGISIPPQPQIMVDLQREQVSPDCSINRIAELISQDVGIAGSILKTVNSPFYGLKNKISSIQQACNLMGINSVINIVNALSIRSELSDEHVSSLNKFWDSAMDIAMACTTIAKQLGIQSPDEAYTVGLFHNCGVPLLMQRFDNYPEVMVASYGCHNQRIVDSENHSLNTNHAVVGYYIAKSWNLPAYISEAIADHHSCAAIFANPDYPKIEKKNLLAILKMAEHICGNYKIIGNQTEDFEWQQIEETLLIYVGLSHYDFEGIKATCLELGLGSSDYFDQ